MKEKELIRRCQDGEKQAFEELIRMFYPYVTGFLVNVTKNNDLSEDLCQETFLRMIRNIDRYDLRKKAAFGTWLITIAKNCYIDYLRKNNVSFSDIDELAVSDGKSIEDDVEKHSQFNEIMDLLDGLPPEQAQAIKMKYLEDMSLAQIAELSGVPAKTVKSRIHDGTAKLRRKTGADNNERMITL